MTMKKKSDAPVYLIVFGMLFGVGGVLLAIVTASMATAPGADQAAAEAFFSGCVLATIAGAVMLTIGVIMKIVQVSTRHLEPPRYNPYQHQAQMHRSGPPPFPREGTEGPR